jgi:hypothetical protein
MKSAVLYQVRYLLKDLVVYTYKATGYLNSMVPVIPASLSSATMVKFSLFAGNMKFKIQSEEWVSICVILCIILNVHFSNIMWNKYLLPIMG